MAYLSRADDGLLHCEAKLLSGFFLLFVLVATVLPARSQQSDLDKYMKLGLPESAGPVRVIYSPGAKDRALRYQRSFAAAVAWDNQQLKLNVPFMLVVVDKEAWGKVDKSYPMPYCNWRTTDAGVTEGFVVLPARMEDFPGSAQLAPDPDLLAEGISFHEAGHIFAHVLGIGSKNRFVQELIANFFMAGYIRAGHTEYAFMTAGPPALIPTPRYTSLADLDLLPDIEMLNYAWFELNLQKIADLSLEGQDFPGTIRTLQSVFPATDSDPASVEDILRRLEKVHPGITKAIVDLAGPSTIDRVNPTKCGTAGPSVGPSVLIVQNETGGDLNIKLEDGKTIQIPAGAHRSIDGKSGQHVMLSAERCLMFGSNPRLAVLTTH